MKPLLNRKYLAVLAYVLFAASTAVSGQVTVAVATVDNPQPATGVLESSGPISTARVGVHQVSSLPLSLDDAIRRGLSNNNDIEISRTDVRFFEQGLRAAKGVYDPVLSFAPNYSRSQTTGGRATNDFTVGADARGFIKPGGGTYGGVFNNNRTENAFAQQQASSGTVNSSGTSAIFTSSLGFQYTQPLLRNFAIDRNRQQIKIIRRSLAQSDTDFRLKATTTISQVQRAYWDLVFALRDQQNQQANVSLARENLRQIEARIAAGASAPIERAEIETELANREGQLLSSIQQVGIAENSLKQLILKDVTAPEWQQTIVPTDKPAFGLTTVNLDDALRDATENRFELKRLRLENEINQIDVAYYRNQVKPQLDLNSRFSLNGLSRGGTNSPFTTNLFTSPGDIVLFNAINQIRATPNVNLPPITNPSILIPAQPAFLFGGFNRSLANLFRSDAPNYSLGVTFSFPLRNRVAKANLAGARIISEKIAAQTRSQEQTVIVEVRNAVQSVETSRQRVLTARRARESAETQLEGERKLYEAGRSTTFLLFQRENTLNNARNAEIRAETDYNKAVAELQRATATSFRENNITIDTPVDLP